ncbi:MAG: hypothetical protein ISR47_09275 [Rhodospirillales bacterium]|nr:hypothetical protein [Rhodospirillales bacterium]
MPVEKNPPSDRKTSISDQDFDVAWETAAKVSFKVRLPKETLDLLRDLSLARAIYDLAASVKINNKGGKFRQPSVSRVISQIIEDRRVALEKEVEIVRGITRNKKITAMDERKKMNKKKKK